MKSILLTTNSKKDLQLLTAIAKRIGVKVKILSKEQVEDLGLAQAIKQGRTGKFINTDKFLKSHLIKQ